MNRGIQIDGFEEIEWDGMIVEVIGVNTLTDWCVVGNSEIGADKIELLTEGVELSDKTGVEWVGREGKASLIDEWVVLNDVVYEGWVCVVGGDEVIDISVMAAVSEIFETGKDIHHLARHLLE